MGGQGRVERGPVATRARATPALVPGLEAVEGLRVRSNGLLLPQGMPFDVWQRVGDCVLLAVGSLSWWVGDWLVFGEHTYGDRYQAAIAQTSLEYQTLRNYAWVARKFPMARRRDALSIGHHSEVAALTEPEQDAWLTRAERLGWSRNELRRRLKAAVSAAVRGPAQGRAAPERSVSLAVSAQQHDRWQAAAEQVNCPVADWIVDTLDRAAGRIGTPVQS
ncbi:hypothetical protein JOD54_004627 [Actinokineospora baliensis]|uniref:LmbU family transcriptional regulator n=1 Tax=Actinokineospora baliensis TaxID=547056 RepID=UPI0019571154|nr:LmbU family transcriptional regulator [Actinokineospora baliensis]MBM7774423.1 hypothetical protein [Actinokineospora baliensis]